MLDYFLATVVSVAVIVMILLAGMYIKANSVIYHCEHYDKYEVRSGVWIKCEVMK